MAQNNFFQFFQEVEQKISSRLTPAIPVPSKPATIDQDIKPVEVQITPIPEKPLVKFDGQIVIVGGGAICNAYLSCLPKLVDFDIQKLVIIDVVDRREALKKFGNFKFLQLEITKENYETELDKILNEGDIFIDLAYNIATMPIAEWATKKGVMFANTALFDWDTVEEDCFGVHPSTETESPFFEETDDQMVKTKQINQKTEYKSATMVLAHGANPGFVNHAAKQALGDIARKCISEKVSQGLRASYTLQDLEAALKVSNYGLLCHILNVSVIQISELDTQRLATTVKPPASFYSPWNIPSFQEESAAAAEFAWGTDNVGQLVGGGEKYFSYGFAPKGEKSFVHMPVRAMEFWTRSVLPTFEGEFRGTTPHHEETITMAEYFTLRNPDTNEIISRPAVWFCYRPMPVGLESLEEFKANDFDPKKQPHTHMVSDEIVSGRDNLGVMILGHPFGAWWTGSLLDITEAKRLAPGGNSATSLQVGAALSAATVFMAKNPKLGIHFPETLPSEEIIQYARPWLGPWYSGPVKWDNAPKSFNDFVVDKFGRPATWTKEGNQNKN